MSRRERERERVMESTILLLVLQIFLLPFTRAQLPGFLSLDCGGTHAFTDDIGLQWTPDDKFMFGQTANFSLPNNNKNKQFTTVRYFPTDDRKYCYTLNVTTRLRYLVRTTFLYGNFDNTNMYPKFDISLGATPWTTVVITDPSVAVTKEMVLLAPSPSLSVCLVNATSGVRFISTIELREFKGPMYYTLFENQYFMSLGARVNFGALSNASIRYPDDEFDRIWESDAVQRPNFLVDVAPGTKKVSTTKPILIYYGEKPPLKVMQTAVVGNNGTLSYRLDLDDFPGYAWAFTYLAEIENLAPNETRKYKVYEPWEPPVNDAIVNVKENAGGNFRIYEPGFWNVSLPYVASLLFRKTDDSSRGPILNAFEIFKYVEINFGSLDATSMANFVARYSLREWAQEGGDPCLPAPWSWVQCSRTQPRITLIKLSEKGLSGGIPPELTNLTDLIELYLDGNSLIGTLPDFSGFTSLQIIHLENNELTGSLPSSLAKLPNLKELYVQNNNLSGIIPQGLFRKKIIFNYSGNSNLHKQGKGKIIIILPVLGAVLMLIFFTICFFFIRHRNRRLLAWEIDTETARKFDLSEIKEATANFEKVIGGGGFGKVYYGRLQDGNESEIAIKVQNIDSSQGIQEFLNEVTLLSRIHHRNLVKFIGYCRQEDNNMLVYEFMHNGTLTYRLRGPPEERIVSWIKRLEIAEDAAKGIEYLHKGCLPAIMHRDLKTSNILLDKDMKAKVSDFGLSKFVEEFSYVSSTVKGTLGYLDPEYYTTQQYTDKSDVYSFGIILLELISGHPPASETRFGPNFSHIIVWSNEHIESGNIDAIIDPSLEKSYDIQSIWKIAEIAIMCVRPMGIERPNISEVLKEIQEAILLEQKILVDRADTFDVILGKPRGSTARFDARGLKFPGSIASFTDEIEHPTLR